MSLSWDTTKTNLDGTWYIFYTQILWKMILCNCVSKLKGVQKDILASQPPTVKLKVFSQPPGHADF